VDIIVSDKSFKEMCYKINKHYAEDIYQETICEILTIADERLPDLNYLKFWFYRVAFNVMSRNGKLGKIVLREVIEFDIYTPSELSKEIMTREAEQFMLSLNEFENRIILLYNQFGDMKKVQRLTGISYSALRAVKEKIKQKAKQI
jgi:DNA-directed RNA polymerase specialized sigma24 family protein